MISDLRSVFKSLAAFDLRSLAANRLFRMSLVGATGFLIQATFFEITGIQLEFFSPPTAALLGAEVSIVANFLLNNRFTFPERYIPFSRGMVKKFFQFNAAVALSLITQWLMVFVGERVLGGSDMVLRLFNIFGVLVGFTMNYMSYTRIIWRRSAPKGEVE